MRSRLPLAATLGLMALAVAAPAQSVTQASNYSEEAIAVGDGGYVLNFTVQWSSDDDPSATLSAPGRIDLIDGNGAVAGQLSASLGGGNPIASVSGPGAVANVSGELDQSGGGGTAATGTLSGTWTLSGLAAGAYTLRFWSFQEADSSRDASTIWTATWDGGGGGPIELAPAPAPTPVVTPDPTPDPAPVSAPPAPTASAPSPPAPAASPPSVAISAPASVTAGQSYYVSATATAASGGNPLQTVILEQSTDGGATWNEIGATPTASSPTDTVGNPVSFDQAGSVALQALVYDSAGLEGTANQMVTVAPAYVSAPVAAPEVDPAPTPAPAPAPTDPPSTETAVADPPNPAPAPSAVTGPADVPAPDATVPAATPASPVPASTPTAANPVIPATPPSPGVVLTSDAARTLRSDRHTWTTSLLCGQTPPESPPSTPMNSPTYPFPLAVNSSQHSHYHRFLLGASAAVLAPFPRPDCLGALAAEMPELTSDLTLAKWRTLYHAAVPWVPGFDPGHYRTGQVPAHRPLPETYGRPTRKFAAYDLVQIADPSVSALALVAGDRRVLDGFIHLHREFCGRLEAHAAAYRPGPAGLRVAGRCVLGRFAEPNNRWQLPFLHVHARVLNFTSFRETPRNLVCLDPASLAQGCRRAAEGGLERQAGQLRELGYRVDLPRDPRDGLRVGGVSETLLAAMAAPRTALLRLLHRLVGPVGDPARAASGTEREAAAIAAMADRLEERVVESRSFYRPPKVSLPCEGPWRDAVGSHLRTLCPQDLSTLHAAAIAARGKDPAESVGGRERDPVWNAFPVPAADRGHRHRPAADELSARDQGTFDCELSGDVPPPGRAPVPAPWLVARFEEELAAVRRDLLEGLRPDAALTWRRAAARLDALSEGPDPGDLRAAEQTLEAGLARQAERIPEPRGRPGRPEGERPIEFASLDELFERSRTADETRTRERGGISR